MSEPGTCPRATATIAEAAASLRGGGVGAIPTETLYGLAAAATIPAAVARLVSLKGREPGKPIALLVDGIDMLTPFVTAVPTAAALLAEAFWPGPLTLVFNASDAVDAALTAASGTIGVRVSSCATATELVTAVGAPLTAPSANPAGMPAPRRLAEVWDYFADRIDFYLDGGDLPGEPASTVVDVRHGLEVLRSGAVPIAAIERVLRAASPPDR